MTIINMVGGGGTSGPKVPLDAISVISVVGGDTEATITWTDPSDLVVNGVTVATWTATKLVRKVGSAPTSINDGTLVLTETTRNTYSVTGYTDTGLTNGTTYYYAAFAIADNGLVTISSTTPSVTPEQGGWQPGANCVAYYPFDTDTNDAVGSTTFSVVSSGISLQSINGLTALYNNGSGTSKINIPYTKASVATVFCRVYPLSAGTDKVVIGNRFSGGGYDQHRTIDINTNRWIGTRWDSGPYNLNSNVAVTTQRYCIGYIETASGAALYINGNITPVATNSTPSNWAGLTQDVGILSWVDGNNRGRSFYGYMSNLVLYNAEKTASDYIDFYNQTKSLYGIS